MDGAAFADRILVVLLGTGSRYYLPVVGSRYVLLSELLRRSSRGRMARPSYTVSSDICRQLRSILRSVPAFEKDAMSRHREHHRREMQPCISRTAISWPMSRSVPGMQVP